MQAETINKSACVTKLKQETHNTKYAMKVVGRLIKIDDQALLIQDISF